MGILRRLREWREDKNGTLIGPNIDADSVDAGSVNTQSLVIGGTLYEEDNNSPINAANEPSVTHTMADPSAAVIIIPDATQTNPTFNEIQINGESNNSYDYTDNNDSETTGVDRWEIPRLAQVQSLILRNKRGDDRIGMRVNVADTGTAQTVYGECDANALGNEITQITALEAGESRHLKARVYRRVMEV